MENYNSKFAFGESVYVDFKLAGNIKDAKIIKASFSKEKTFYDLEITLMDGWTTRIYNVESNFIIGLKTDEDKKKITENLLEYKKSKMLEAGTNRYNEFYSADSYTKKREKKIEAFFNPELIEKVKILNSMNNISTPSTQRDHPVEANKMATIRSIQVILNQIIQLNEQTCSFTKEAGVHYNIECINEYIEKVRKKVQSLKD